MTHRAVPLRLLLVSGATALLAGVTAAGVAGCAADPVAPTTPSTTALTADYAAVDGEYQAAKAELTLPEGISFPGHLPDTGDHYPPGMGTTAAQTFWLCSWLRDYLDSPPSARARASAAATQLKKFKDMNAYTDGLEAGGRSAVDAAIAGAESGRKQDPGEFVERTCGGPFYSLADPHR